MNELSISKYAIMPSTIQLSKIIIELSDIYHAPKYLP